MFIPVHLQVREKLRSQTSWAWAGGMDSETQGWGGRVQAGLFHYLRALGMYTHEEMQ